MDASSAALAVVADSPAVSAAVAVMVWAVACSSVADDETVPTMPPTARSKPSARSTMVRRRASAAAASAMRLTSASSAAFRATIALMSSTARPTAPISSPRRASAISASIAPCAIRCSTATRRPSGRLMPRIATSTAATMPARSPSPVRSHRLRRVAAMSPASPCAPASMLAAMSALSFEALPVSAAKVGSTSRWMTASASALKFASPSERASETLDMKLSAPARTSSIRPAKLGMSAAISPKSWRRPGAAASNCAEARRICSASVSAIVR
ncbi:hypothetical protein BHAOGJBA_5842 [Methylobacterium hispanicum]|uniref:Uncharacterized protein n=1 Tax=Methylobacterium hispanicum TaxID=270350 RepID=A0AAV4ZVX0_9HYPH|nr:hypothetical protein BHAOGJBA_5842 [Methylobacterium hispanicum]